MLFTNSKVFPPSDGSTKPKVKGGGGVGGGLEGLPTSTGDGFILAEAALSVTAPRWSSSVFGPRRLSEHPITAASVLVQVHRINFYSINRFRHPNMASDRRPSKQISQFSKFFYELMCCWLFSSSSLRRTSVCGNSFMSQLSSCQSIDLSFNCLMLFVCWSRCYFRSICSCCKSLTCQDSLSFIELIWRLLLWKAGRLLDNSVVKLFPVCCCWWWWC